MPGSKKHFKIVQILVKAIILFLSIWPNSSYEENKTANRKTYYGYRTYKVFPTKELHYKALIALKNLSGIDFWSSGISKRGSTSVMVAPERVPIFRGVLGYLPHRMYSANVGKLIDRERRKQEVSRTKSINVDNIETFLNHYLRYKEIIEFLKKIKQNHPENVRLGNIGKSFQGRQIYLAKLSNDFRANKTVVMVEAGMHAREWVSPALALYAIYRILNEPELLSQNDWHILPLANPDGYEYTHTVDRLWRKTRSQTKDEKCFGVDGNRNFDSYWGHFASTRPCDQDYQGSKPFSESETTAIRFAASKIKHRLQTYISLHSFGNTIMYPYAFTKNLTSDWMNLEACAIKARDVLVTGGGPKFKVGNTAKLLYMASGGADDFMKQKLHIPFSYTIELPGGGKSGFDFPPSEIIPMVIIMFPLLSTLANCTLVL